MRRRPLPEGASDSGCGLGEGPWGASEGGRSALPLYAYIYRGMYGKTGWAAGCRCVDSSALEILFVFCMCYGCPVACRAVCLWSNICRALTLPVCHPLAKLRAVIPHTARGAGAPTLFLEADGGGAGVRRLPDAARGRGAPVLGGPLLLRRLLEPPRGAAPLPRVPPAGAPSQPEQGD